MSAIATIALRNLVRQKRRSFLLGVAIAFGACILVMLNSLSLGLTKVLFERIVKYTNGHVAVSFMKNGNMMNQIFHDGDRIRAVIAKVAPEAIRGGEEAIGLFGRAIGNGIADNVILVGVDINGKLTKNELKEFEQNFKMIEGSFESLGDKSLGIPVVVAEQKAKYLKVKMGDPLKVRFTGANNQTASAKLVVTGIFKPSNAFMASPVFLELNDVRNLAGYGPHDIPTLQLNMENPQKYAKGVANRIYAALKPATAVIEGTAACRGTQGEVAVFGYRSNKASLALLTKNMALEQGDSASAFGYEGVVLSPRLAARHGAGPGDTVRVSWRGKYDTAAAEANFIVTAVAKSGDLLPRDWMLVNDRNFYRWYYMPLAAPPSAALAKALPDSLNPLFPALAPEFTLMKRAATTNEYMKAFRELSQQRVRGIVVSVQSMYETASMIINLEYVLFVITFVVGVILFCVILIGVINTLRMTIKERTREIGTVRAIGMQKSDVLRIFLLETGYLALFASLAGTGLAFLGMWGISSIAINAADNPMSMLLVNSRIFFAPNPWMIVLFNIIIVAIAVGTAYFPANRASRLSAANAMRHYE